jgi:hypothetical protein
MGDEFPFIHLKADGIKMLGYPVHSSRIPDYDNILSNILRAKVEMIDTSIMVED